MMRTSLSLCALWGSLAAVQPADASEPLPLRRPGFSSYVMIVPVEDEEPPPVHAPAEEELSEQARAEVEVDLSPEMIALRDRIDRTLQFYYDRPENVAQRSVWGVMHALIAYGVDTEVIAGDRKVNAIGWICYNGACRGQRLFYLDAQGRLVPREGPGLQGHGGQFLAMLAQSRVKKEFPIRVEGKDFTVQDLIEYEQRTCYSKTELTFKLIGLAHYLPSDATWKNDRGETWSIPRLIQEELAQPIIGAACGGTHRLTGFSYAVNKRQTRGETFEGEWLRAQIFEASYQDYLMRLRNPEGSFSTQWFAGRGEFGDDKKKIETTGHMAEWMVYSLPKARMSDRDVVGTIDFLNNVMWRNRNNDLGIGPRGHALHALVMYQQKMFDVPAGHRSPQLAKEPRQAAGK